ncbi:MAG: hypothetical protein CSA38_03660 [Flavobacteriales bacterium]|nr:MAG: hypothetical protein CSA38_03660 [Flavobacteriales bacterium]
MNNFNKKRTWSILLVLQFFIFYGVSQSKVLIHQYICFFERQKDMHTLLFSKIPFSVGDVLYLILGGVLLYFVIQIFNKKKRKKALLKLLMITTIFYFVYQVFWGLLYFQKPLIYELPKGRVSLKFKKALAKKYFFICLNERKWVEEDENGVMKISDIPLLKKEIINRQSSIPFPFNTMKTEQITNIKESLYADFLSHIGILGYFNPFTGEAQYNDNIPHIEIPFTLAHESAHQIGYAREEEASFIGFLMGEKSENHAIKYSVYWYGLKSLLRNIAMEDLAFAQKVLENFSPAMKRDYEAKLKYSEQYQGILNDWFGTANDLFLKSNQQDGIISYSYFTTLLLRYEYEKRAVLGTAQKHK